MISKAATIVAIAAALTVGACSPHKKEVVAPPAVEKVIPVPKLTLENLDSRLKAVEERNKRIDALVRRRHVREGSAQ